MHLFVMVGRRLTNWHQPKNFPSAVPSLPSAIAAIALAAIAASLPACLRATRGPHMHRTTDAAASPCCQPHAPPARLLPARRLPHAPSLLPAQRPGLSAARLPALPSRGSIRRPSRPAATSTDPTPPDQPAAHCHD